MSGSWAAIAPNIVLSKLIWTYATSAHKGLHMWLGLNINWGLSYEEKVVLWIREKFSIYPPWPEFSPFYGLFYHITHLTIRKYVSYICVKKSSWCNSCWWWPREASACSWNRAEWKSFYLNSHIMCNYLPSSLHMPRTDHGEDRRQTSRIQFSF